MIVVLTQMYGFECYSELASKEEISGRPTGELSELLHNCPLDRDWLRKCLGAGDYLCHHNPADDETHIEWEIIHVESIDPESYIKGNMIICVYEHDWEAQYKCVPFTPGDKRDVTCNFKDMGFAGCPLKSILKSMLRGRTAILDKRNHIWTTER